MTESNGDDLLAEFDTSIERLPDSVDRAAVERMRTVAYVLDESIRVPGTDYRIGVDPLLGAVPVVGDILSGGFSLYVVLESARLGVSYTTLLEMLANVTLDVVGGTIPYAGSVVDAVWKSNKRNLALALDDLAADWDESTEEAPETEATIDEDQSEGIEIEVTEAD